MDNLLEGDTLTNHQTLNSTSAVLLQIDLCVRNYKYHVQGLTLSELHHAHGLLMRYGTPVPLGKGDIENGVGNIIHKGIVITALLRAKREILGCMNERIVYLSDPSGYPTGDDILERYE